LILRAQTNRRIKGKKRRCASRWQDGHGHAFGFFDQFQKRADLQVVGIAEPIASSSTFTKRFGWR